jgi:hypothetical protein
VVKQLTKRATTGQSLLHLLRKLNLWTYPVSADASESISLCRDSLVFGGVLGYLALQGIQGGAIGRVLRIQCYRSLISSSGA